MAEETLHVTCPVCGRRHSYPLEVERSIILAFRVGPDPPPDRRVFTRIFACPIEHKNFQGKITLTDTALDRIKAVTVGDPTDQDGS